MKFYLYTKLLVISLFLLAMSFFSVAQSNGFRISDTGEGPHIQVALMSEQNALVPGRPQLIGVYLQPDPQWHTYWRNPGDSGEAPSIELSSTAKISFGDIQWPIPKAIPVAHLVNYGYEADNLLMIEVFVPQDIVPDGTLTESAEDNLVTINGDLSWLVCKEDCIPGDAQLSITLPIASESRPSAYAALFEDTKSLLPDSYTNPEPADVNAKFEINDTHIVLEVEKSQSLGELNLSKLTLFPFRSDVIKHAAEQRLIESDDAWQFIIPKSPYFNGEAENLAWLLSDGQKGIYFDASINSTLVSNDMSAAYSADRNLDKPSIDAPSLLIYALMAFAGGLILNLMPCVLPVLSIKAISLTRTAPSFFHKSAYFFGVLACFNAFALIIIILQSTGEQIGWGFHMQSPLVVTLLAFLFTFIGLVLLDVIQVGNRMSNIGNSLVSGERASAHFATGVLAVIVASPCTAPFMAAALGIALISEPYVTFILFNALAIGFALPITLLFISSRMSALLPKPGAWMTTFKHVLAFPMFASVAWLAWVYVGQKGAPAQFLLLISLLIFSLFIWLSGHAKGQGARFTFNILALLSIILPISASSLMVNTNEYASTSDSQSVAKNHVDYSEEKLNALKASQQVVFVNMTADWCITCKVNEQVALSSEQVQSLLKEEDVHYVIGDWTNKNQEILRYLKQYKRAGVPLYVVYSGTQNVNVLPQILTPDLVSKAIINAKEELKND